MLSKSQARIFFLGGTILTFLIFLGLTWTSLSKEIPKRTHYGKSDTSGDSRKTSVGSQQLYGLSYDLGRRCVLCS